MRVPAPEQEAMAAFDPSVAVPVITRAPKSAAFEELFVKVDVPSNVIEPLPRVNIAEPVLFQCELNVIS